MAPKILTNSKDSPEDSGLIDFALSSDFPVLKSVLFL